MSSASNTNWNYLGGGQVEKKKYFLKKIDLLFDFMKFFMIQ